MTDSAVIPAEPKMDLALLKAVGLDRAAPEQRRLAIAIAERYSLDLLLKHLVLIEGRPYITRDALLHIAHRSGQFDGIATTRPVLEGDYWTAECTVWRKDMQHAFTYSGRYPTKGGNARFAPEMAVKVAESMTLRRAFDVAAPVVEERWDVDVSAEPPAPRPTLAERAAAKAAEVTVLDEPMTAEASAAVDGPLPEPPVVPPSDETAWNRDSVHEAAQAQKKGRQVTAAFIEVQGDRKVSDLTPLDWALIAKKAGLE